MEVGDALNEFKVDNTEHYLIEQITAFRVVRYIHKTYSQSVLNRCNTLQLCWESFKIHGSVIESF